MCHVILKKNPIGFTTIQPLKLKKNKKKTWFIHDLEATSDQYSLAVSSSTEEAQTVGWAGEVVFTPKILNNAPAKFYTSTET